MCFAFSFWIVLTTPTTLTILKTAVMVHISFSLKGCARKAFWTHVTSSGTNCTLLPLHLHHSPKGRLPSTRRRGRRRWRRSASRTRRRRRLRLPTPPRERSGPLRRCSFPLLFKRSGPLHHARESHLVQHPSFSMPWFRMVETIKMWRLHTRVRHVQLHTQN